MYFKMLPITASASAGLLDANPTIRPYATPPPHFRMPTEPQRRIPTAPNCDFCTP